jgi:HEAT repeat protein
MEQAARSDLATLLETLAGGGQETAIQLTALSALSRDEVPVVEEAWRRLPAGTRERVISRAGELAEDDVHLDFVALARIALADSEPAVRRRGAEALWETDHRGVAGDLVKLLRDDPDESVRAAAADSLMHFVLLYELGEFNPAEGRRLVDALRASAENVGESIDVRARAIETLGACSEPWVDSLITTAYYHDDRRMRLASVHAMGASAEEKWLEYVYEALQSDDPEFRFEGANAAGVIGAEEATDAVAALLEDEDSEVALAAVHALGEISGERAIEYLRGFAEHAPAPFQEQIEAAIEEALFAMDGREAEDFD